MAPNTETPAEEPQDLKEALDTLMQAAFTNGMISERGIPLAPFIDVSATLSRIVALFAKQREEIEGVRSALANTGIGGIFDLFDGPADAITQMGLHIHDLEAQLERQRETTLTQEEAESLVHWIEAALHRTAWKLITIEKRAVEKLRLLSSSPLT